jgi:vitamin B12 transporter
VTRTPLPAAVLTAFLPLWAAAQEATLLDPVVVTATRTAQTADETLASVTVVDREEIERRQARSVADALRGIPGLAIANQGGRGKLTSFFLRGAESDQVLVLIDGVRIGSATAGLAAIQDIPVEQVERIEVVRGPRSSLYGSEAIGGVIQIFTRRGGGGLAPRVTIGVGSDQTVEGALGISGGGERGWLDVGVGFERTQGFDACTGEPFVGGCGVIEPDKDGYRNGSGSVRAGYRFDRGEIDLHWLRTESDLEFDGFTNESQGVQQVLGARASLTPLESWDLKLSAGRSRDELDSFWNGLFSSRFETIRDSLSWQNDVALGDAHLVTLGVDHLEDRVDGSVDYTVDSRGNTGVFGQYQGDYGAHRVTASLRHDDNEQFGGYTTGDLAWGYELADGLRLMASYGTAFKAPTFNDLYYPFIDFGGGFGYAGNPDLDPETSRSLELGLSGPLPAGTWSVNVYQTDLDDLIAPGTIGNLSTSVNLDKARIRGLEALVVTRLAGWELNADLTLLDPRDRSDGRSRDELLPRRPEQTFRLDLDRSFGPIRAGGSVFLSGRSYDLLFDGSRVRLDGYALVDLRAEYLFSDSLRLQARLENLLDKDYETLAYYNQPGRGVYLTLRYAP